MKKLLILTALSLFLGGVFSIRLSAQNFSNKGTDFWLMYPAHIDGTASRMGLYISSDVNTTGTVYLNGTSISFSVTANQATVVPIFPTTYPIINLQDDAINTGYGIHIISVAPVVVYSHVLNQARSGSTLILPTNTLGREYIAVGYKSSGNSSGTSGGANSGSQFEVVAVQDNTTVEITPSVTNLSGTRPANVVYTITMNKGDVYQFRTTYSNDVTGTKIRTISSVVGQCQPIAVFSGSSWTSMNCNGASGGDNLFLQLLPKSAWGMNYVTAPMAGRQYDIFRVIVTDPTTVVTRNGAVLTGLVNNTYYEFTSTVANVITSDKPITLIQYMISQTCDTRNNGSSLNNPNYPGDPEMIIVNPVEQTINDVTVVSARNNLIGNTTNISVHYFTLIMKSVATSSLRIDNALPVASWIPIGTSGYSYLQENVTASTALNASHHIKADSGFIALAYGLGAVESYGYNAGMNIKDLYQFPSISNTYATVDFPAACRTSPFKIRMTFPYQPTSITWQFSGLFPNYTMATPVPDSVYVVSGKTLYRYTIPLNYTIGVVGSYPIRVLATNPTPDGCSGQQIIDYILQVFDRPNPQFYFTNTGCVGDSVHFHDTTSNTGGRPVIKYWWGFGDGGYSLIQNPVHLYASPGFYNAQFALITDIGCVSDTTIRTLQVNYPPTAKFGIVAPYCVNRPIKFIDSSFGTGTSIAKWYWTFGDASPTVMVTNNSPQYHSYAATGTYTITLQVETPGGCRSTIASKTFTVNPRASVDFTFGNGCLPSATVQFTNGSTISDNTALTYQWNFGVAGGTSTATNPSYTYTGTGPYNVTMIANTINGCLDTIAKPVATIYPQPHATFTIDKHKTCVGDNFSFTSTATAQNSSVTEWHWNFGDASTSTVQNPTKSYSTPGTYIIQHWAKSAIGCMSDTTKDTVIVYAPPISSFAIAAHQCVGDTLKFTSNSIVGANTITQYHWYVNNTLQVSALTGVFNYIPPIVGPLNIRLSIQTAAGCSDDTTVTVNVNTKPVPDFNLPNVCLPAGTANFLNNTTISDGTLATVTYVWNFGDGGTSTQTTPTHVFTTTGPYNISLSATSVNGCKKDTIKTLSTIYLPPQAHFIIDKHKNCVGNNFNFTSTSVAPGNTVAQWHWNFGDGNTSSSTNPANAFSAPGTYIVTHWVQSSAGCSSDTAKDTVIVYAQPIASYTITAHRCTGDTITFTSTSNPNSATITQYQWYVNGVINANTSSIFYYAPPTSGNVPIRLVITTDIGCTDDTTVLVLVNPKPVPDFTLPNVCLPIGAASFTNNTTISDGTIGSVTYNWTFGDGGTSTQTNPAHNFTTTGPYNIHLTATSNNGCVKDTIKQLSTIYAQPHAAFTIDRHKTCIGNTFTFTDGSSAAASTVTQWFWNFGDGNTSNAQNPVKTYSTPGTYIIKLYVQSAIGCISDTASDTLRVYALPIASFIINAHRCELDSLYMVSNSTATGGNINQYQWYVDGVLAPSTINSFVYFPATAATYNIKLAINTDIGCYKDTTVPIVVHPKPVPDFNLPNVCLPIGAASFTNSTTINDGTLGAVTYQWNFGDGGTSTQTSPSHNFTATGPYNIHLTATSNNGCVRDTIKQLSTIYAQPHASFTIDKHQNCVGNDFNFASTATAPASSMVQWFWNFGDGNTSTLQNVTKQYSAPGTYIVRHWGVSAIGCMSDTTKDTVIVFAQPVASYIIDPHRCEGDTLKLTSNSLGNGVTISQYQWSVNSVVTSASGNIFYYVPPAFGNVSIQLGITTAIGCTDDTTVTILVHPKPLPDFTIPNVCLPSGSATFTNNTTITDGTLPSVTYQWNFGDGGVSTQTTPTHIFTAVGPYNIHLTATSNKGCVKDTIKSITTIYAQPQAVFTAVPAEVCVGGSFSFVDSSYALASTITNWLWAYDDGTTDTIQNPTHTFATVGTHVVTLKVTSAIGCVSAITSHTVYVNRFPSPHFNIGAPMCVTKDVTFTDNSIPNDGVIATWNWDMGDGTTHVGGAPFQHAYSITGNYGVTLTITTSKGCTKSYTDTVRVHPLPVPGFIKPQNCLSDTMSQFTDTSSIASPDHNVSYSWNFGDAWSNPPSTNISSLQNPTHHYTHIGYYPVGFTVTSNNGCTNFLTDTIVISGTSPYSDFKVLKPKVCSNKQIQLRDSSWVAIGNIVKLQIWWNGYDTTQRQTIISPVAGTTYTHSYPELFTQPTKSYVVRVIAFSGQTCFNEVDSVVTVMATPKLGFDSIPPICGNDAPFTLTQFARDSNYVIIHGSGVFTGETVTSGGIYMPDQSTPGTHLIHYAYTGANGCTNSKDRYITVYPVPTVNAGPDKFVLEYSVDSLEGSGTGNILSWVWTPGKWLSNDSIPRPLISPHDDDMITYTLTAISTDGCHVSDQMVVKILKLPLIPNVFTPNGDNINDKWVIKYLNDYPGATVEIYNRYGQLVFKSQGYSDPWDGTMNGKELPVGTYYYLINPMHGRKQMSGFVDLIR